jgi:hypothetical protein
VDIKSIVRKRLLDKSLADVLDLWLLPYTIPALTGVILGVALAVSIVQGNWYLSVALVLAVPGIIVINRYPLVASVIWFALMPFLPFETVSSRVFWIIHRMLMPLAMGLTIVVRLSKVKKYAPVQLGLAELSMVVYLVLGAISIMLTRQSPLSYLYELYDRMFVPFTAYWLMRLSSPGEQDLKHLVNVALFLCIAEIGIGFWARYVPHILPAIWRISRMDPERMSGTFDNPTPYACVMITCMCLLFHTAMNCKAGTKRTLLILVFALGLLCVFLTFTRGCWGAAILVLAGLFYLYPKQILPLIAVAAPIILILFASVFADEAGFALTRLGTQDTVDSRIVLLNAGIQMFRAKPVFGWGFGNYDRYDWQFMERVGNAAPTSWDVQSGTSHNTYITILAEAGAVGFFFLFLPLFWWLVLSVKVLPRLPRQGFWSWRLLVTLWLPVLFYLISSQVVDMRFFWYQIGVWWMLLGLIASLVQTYLRPGDLGTPNWMRQAATLE